MFIKEFLIVVKNINKNFLRITADNVFLDPILINQAIKFYNKKI